MSDQMAIDTYTLISLINDAEKRGYNRQIDLAKLNPDPTGWHLICKQLLHEHVARVSQPENWQVRCLILMKFVDQDMPTTGYLDVNINLWNDMVDLAEVDDNTGVPALTVLKSTGLFRPRRKVARS